MLLLALPLPLVNHVCAGAQKVLVLSGELVVLVPVVVAADTAVLALDGWGGHDLDEVTIVDHPDAEEGVNIVG